ncbi:MAG: cytochrome c oxidase subunit [Actinomycetota bacterium]|jgi:cytochrome c oxidase subunit 4|nr:cytochrome c oxidase subunit [Actinomycetota bacterium]
MTDPTGGPVVATPPEEGGPAHGAAHEHPSDLQYVYIALFLAMVTAAEVAVYYVKSLAGLLVYILVTMAVVKFSVVVMFFMHLRFDSKLFRRFFITGIILALFCYVIVLSTFHIWHR